MKHITIPSILLILVLFMAIPADAQLPLERVKVTEDISMKIPVAFVPMTEADLVRKYVSSRKPIAMYTNSGRTVDLGVNENSSTWAADDLELLKEFNKANILNLFTEVRFIQEDLRQIGDRDFVVFEFVSTITDEESAIGGTKSTSHYTYIQYTIRDEKVLLFNFTCPARIQNQWQSVAKEMMESVRIK